MTAPDAVQERSPGRMPVAGEWVSDGPRADRVGPWTREVVSTARQAERGRRPRPPSPTPGAAPRRSPGCRRRRGPTCSTRGRRSADGAAGRARPPARAGARQAGQGRPGRDRPGRRHVRGRPPPRPARSAARCCRSPAGRAASATPRSPTARRPASRWPSRRSTRRPTCWRTSSAPSSRPATPRSSSRRRRRRPSRPPWSRCCSRRACRRRRSRCCTAAARSAPRCAPLPEVGVISFTGSAATGAAVARAAGAKRLVLELGGNAATIVCEDADIAAAARICARTGYSNSGQSCISVQRVYVHRSRYDEFVDAFTARGGDARRSATRSTRPPTSGPWSTTTRPSGWSRWADEAAAAGATITTGGRRDGATVIPTVVASPAGRRPADPRRGVRRARQRAALRRLRRRDRRLQRQPLRPAGRACSPTTSAGSSPPGASSRSAAWSSTARRTSGSTTCPFGGVKDSGFGRESPRWMIDDYTVVKTLLLRGMSLFGEQEAHDEPRRA